MDKVELYLKKYLGYNDTNAEHVFVEYFFLDSLHGELFKGVVGIVACESSEEEVVSNLQDDDELWKIVVADGVTTLGLEEFNERRMDNWQEEVSWLRDDLAKQAGYEQDNERFLEDVGGGRCFPDAFEGAFVPAEGEEALVNMICAFEACKDADQANELLKVVAGMVGKEIVKSK